jgi:ribosomal-protein-alanine N-acetyltransferase
MHSETYPKGTGSLSLTSSGRIRKGSCSFAVASMLIADLPQIQNIEKDSASGWNLQQFIEELKQPDSFQYVARENTAASIRAFICGRRVDDEVEILKLAVAKLNRRQGIGLFLLTYALDLLAQQGARSCFLELRSSNSAARRLYEKVGFEQTGIRKKYYTAPFEDAVLMMKKL